MADINWTSPGAIVVYCIIGAGIGYGMYKSNGSDTSDTSRDSFDNPVGDTGVPNRIFPGSGGKKSRKSCGKRNNKTRNKKYKRS
jgi:hypothetical protein